MTPFEFLLLHLNLLPIGKNKQTSTDISAAVTTYIPTSTLLSFTARLLLFSCRFNCFLWSQVNWHRSCFRLTLQLLSSQPTVEVLSAPDTMFPLLSALLFTFQTPGFSLVCCLLFSWSLLTFKWQFNCFHLLQQTIQFLSVFTHWLIFHLILWLDINDRHFSCFYSLQLLLFYC